ncbi:MAG: MerR family transcriptional regulator, partial [Actinomycetota bacterium]|nr:MerR family transcriptional regulator [Actinomycetota bacterium]
MVAGAGSSGLSSTLRGVDAVLESLRRGQRQLTRSPRAAIEAAVKQLLTLGPGKPAARSRYKTAATYRIDDLARAAGTTVRNVRAYQERGLLHAPARVGRTAIFDDTHLTRLKMITSMLDRG